MLQVRVLSRVKGMRERQYLLYPPTLLCQSSEESHDVSAYEQYWRFIAHFSCERAMLDPHESG